MALGVELYALPLDFMAREVALSLFWMLQGSRKPLGPAPSLTRKSLHSTLVAQGFSVEEMLQAGSAMGLTYTSLETLQR